MVEVSRSAADTLPYLVILRSCEDCSSGCSATFETFIDV